MRYITLLLLLGACSSKHFYIDQEFSIRGDKYCIQTKGYVSSPILIDYYNITCVESDLVDTVSVRESKKAEVALNKLYKLRNKDL
jgi:hypothetical protein